MSAFNIDGDINIFQLFCKRARDNVTHLLPTSRNSMTNSLTINERPACTEASKKIAYYFLVILFKSGRFESTVNKGCTFSPKKINKLKPGGAQRSGQSVGVIFKKSLQVSTPVLTAKGSRRLKWGTCRKIFSSLSLLLIIPLK